MNRVITDLHDLVAPGECPYLAGQDCPIHGKGETDLSRPLAVRIAAYQKLRRKPES